MGAGRKQGLISNPRGHGEFVRLTDEGLFGAKVLVVELFGKKTVPALTRSPMRPILLLGGDASTV